MTSALKKDWHKADIRAALNKNGWTTASLSRHLGFTSGALYQALLRPWPKGERAIAEAIGVDPSDIWPSRYLANFRREVSTANAKKAKAA